MGTGLLDEDATNLAEMQRRPVVVLYPPPSIASPAIYLVNDTAGKYPTTFLALKHPPNRLRKPASPGCTLSSNVARRSTACRSLT